MTFTQTVCTDCGRETSVESEYCPGCGSEDPWEEQPVYRFDEDDLPITFAYRIYDDNYGLWRAFCDEYWDHPSITGSDIAGLSDNFPRLKFIETPVYFQITEDLELEGPFLEKP